MDGVGIISKKDKMACLEKVAATYGATLESLERRYVVKVTSTEYPKRTYTANQLYLWISRSGSLREMTESSYVGFKRFSKYLVLYDDKEEICYLLYNTSIKADDYRSEHIVLDSELSIKMNDIFEAMRLISADEIHDALIREYEELMMDDCCEVTK